MQGKLGHEGRQLQFEERPVVKRPNFERYQRDKRSQVALTRAQLRVRGSQRDRRIRNVTAAAVRRAASVAAVPVHLRYYGSSTVRHVLEAFFLLVDSRLQKGHDVTLDFRKIERLYPCGLLLLMGWVDEWVQRFPGRISANYPNDDLVEQMLQHVGVVQKLGLPARKAVVDHSDVLRWHYFHGRNADATPFEPFMVELQALLGEERQVGLGNCVTEAMINVGHHAYANGGPWWSFATVSNKKVFVALYDRGESIPVTLLSKPEVMDILKARMWGQGRGDDQLITAALGGRTRTKLPYRGKGLPEMFEFTKTSQDSELGIFSRHGYFVYDDQKLERSGRLGAPIKGTLVIWMIDISEVKND